ncbi:MULTISPECIES: hypothetical protein [unclassified Duganella]|uniref:hypothetical protein n=1 Tax=unclassified Duganella TaxID=2636909 RepID=UPI00088A862B|nr:MULTISPECIES: hypothetical protein [unclassified Duganella]SDG44827.1 hypothetical protein SAMN05216320_104376 [Duganella sp. OV458]SDJ59071.1 hypothetical protein SAMN05428973_10527 [Duganella sp. OV510]
MTMLTVTLFAAATLAPTAPLPKPADELLAPVLTDEIIKKAVRETIAEDPHPAPAKKPEAGVFRADAVSTRMSAAFEQAKVPDCLHDDALKHQPAHIGPVNVVGPYSLPWIVAAAVRGKCR